MSARMGGNEAVAVAPQPHEYALTLEVVVPEGYKEITRKKNKIMEIAIATNPKAPGKFFIFAHHFGVLYDIWFEPLSPDKDLEADIQRIYEILVESFVRNAMDEKLGGISVH